MAARDRWTITIRCPKCGSTGEVELSQADGWAFMKDQSTSIDHVPDGFKSTADEVIAFVCIADEIRAEKIG